MLRKYAPAVLLCCRGAFRLVHTPVLVYGHRFSVTAGLFKYSTQGRPYLFTAVPVVVPRQMTSSVPSVPPAVNVGFFLHAQGTPVNEETLTQWKADRKAKKLAEERRKVVLW